MTLASPAEGSGRDGMRGLGAFRRLGRARRGCRAFNVSPEGVFAISDPKATDVGPAATPPRGRRAIFIQYVAGMRSSPNMPSTGLALMIGSREANPLSVQPAARLVAGFPGWMPRGGAISPRRRRAPFDTRGCLLPAAQPGGGVCVRGRRRLSISLRRQPGSDTTQDFADLLERLRSVGLRHGHNHGASRAREVVNLCRG